MIKILGIRHLNILKPLKKFCRKQSSSQKPVSSEYKASNIQSVPNFAMYKVHKDMGGTIVNAYYPKNYLKLRCTKNVEAKPERYIMLGGKSWYLKPVPAHVEYIYELLPHYHIDKLATTGKGSGTRSVQAIVRKSLQDVQTQGRVTLEACPISVGAQAPGGFYYKLGFRFNDSDINEECAKWIAAGGKKEDAPFAVGMMYLPRENISHCLKYRSMS